MELFKQIRNHLHSLEWIDLLGYVPTLAYEELPDNDKEIKAKTIKFPGTTMIIGLDHDQKLRVFSTQDLRFVTKDEFVAYLVEDLTLQSFDIISELSVFPTPHFYDDILFDPSDPLSSLLDLEIIDDPETRMYRSIFGDTLPMSFEKKTKNFIFFNDLSFWTFNQRPGIHHTCNFASKDKIIVHFDPRHALMNDAEESGHLISPLTDIRTLKYLKSILDKLDNPFVFNVQSATDYAGLILYAIVAVEQQNKKLRLTSFQTEKGIARCTIDFKENLNSIKKRSVASDLGNRMNSYLTIDESKKEHYEKSLVIDDSLYTDFTSFSTIELFNDQLLIEGKLTKSYAKMLLELFFPAFDIERVGDLFSTDPR